MRFRIIVLRYFLIFSLSILVIDVVCYGVGTDSANFLKIPVGARESSLGGAFTGVSNNANAVYYNPGGLGILGSGEVTHTYNKYVEGVVQQWFAVAYPYSGGVFGLGINYLNVSEFEAYDKDDKPIEKVSANDTGIYVSYGRGVKVRYGFLDKVFYGGGVKYISSRLDSERGVGYGVDLGFLATTYIENFRIGLKIENVVSSEIRFKEVGARPAMRLRSGFMYGIESSAISGLMFALDYVFDGNNGEHIAVGMEHRYRDLSIRMGYSTFGDISNGFNFGLGFDLSRYIGSGISVDYSFGNSYAFGEIHKLGFTYKFGSRDEDKVVREPETYTFMDGGRAKGEVIVEQKSKDKTSNDYLELLRSVDLYQKRVVIMEIGKIGGEESFKVLIGLLKESEPWVVLEAILALRNFHDERAIEPLIELFKVRNVNIRYEAINALEKYYEDKRVVKAVKNLLWDSLPYVRARAAKFLGDRGDVSVEKTLKMALKEEKDNEVRVAIISALKRLSVVIKEK